MCGRGAEAPQRHRLLTGWSLVRIRPGEPRQIKWLSQKLAGTFSVNLRVGATRGLRPPNGSAATPPIRDPRRNRDRWAALLNASRGFCASALAVPELVFASFSVASAAFLGDRDQKSRRPAHLRR